jgi:flavin reductase (DIM6/NTAB) family NADH-FMN oxidoreductase RutF
MAQRAALKIVASSAHRIAPQPSGPAYLEALRQLPRAVSVVTFQRGADWFGLTATSLSSLSLEPPTILLSFDCAANISPAAATKAPFGVSVLAASHAEIADRFRRGALVEPGRTISREVGWRRRPVLYSDPTLSPRSNAKAKKSSIVTGGRS